MKRALFVILWILRSHIPITIAVAAVLASLAMVCSAQAPPIMDTYTASSSPSTNYGTSSILAVQNSIQLCSIQPDRDAYGSNSQQGHAAAVRKCGHQGGIVWACINK